MTKLDLELELESKKINIYLILEYKFRNLTRKLTEYKIIEIITIMNKCKLSIDHPNIIIEINNMIKDSRDIKVWDYILISLITKNEQLKKDMFKKITECIPNSEKEKYEQYFV
jgi:hypothetical protein